MDEREEYDVQVSLSWLPLLNAHAHAISPFVRTTQQISLGTLVTVKLYLYMIMLKKSEPETL